ncbi:MAG TPA: alpha/beta hydrolase [Planococcus sp. (in: firmicutes)]|nr:alpha/beta hydrolase [Planococcus sp. (in: firmicutes)]
MWKWESTEQAKAVIVMVHSAYEHHRRYAWQIEQWRSKGFHVIMSDLPGHGTESLKESAHRESFTDYEKTVAVTIKVGLKDELPVFVIAHGMGATIAMNVLSKSKVDVAGAIFTSPWLNLVKTPSKISNALTSIHKLTANMKIDHDIKTRHLTRSQEVIDTEGNDEMFNSMVTVKWYHDLQSYMKQTMLIKEKFPVIPVSVHTGEKDGISDTSAAKNWLNQQHLKQYCFKEWADCQHDLMQEPEKEDIFAEMQSFVQNRMRSLGYVVD